MVKGAANETGASSISHRTGPGSATVIGAIFIAGALLTGCQTASCTGDPRTDDLHCASHGLSSGHYARQTARLRSQAEMQLMTAAAAAERAGTARQRSRDAKVRAATVQDRVDSQNREIARLREELQAKQQRLDHLRSETGSSDEEIVQLEREIAALREQIAILVDS